ncbi:MAG TPA: hypothetical protein V6D11_32760 [Waterburya sp.]
MQLQTNNLFRDRAWLSATGKCTRREGQSFMPANWVVKTVGVRLQQY